MKVPALTLPNSNDLLLNGSFPRCGHFVCAKAGRQIVAALLSAVGYPTTDGVRQEA